MFERLGNLVSRHGGWVIAAWLLVGVGLHLVAPRWNDVTHDGDLAYLPADMPSVAGERALAEAFPNQQARSNLAIVVERPEGALTRHDLVWSDSLAEKLRDRQDELGVLDVINRNTDVVGEKLTSRTTKNGQATVTLLEVRNEFMAVGNIRLLEAVEAVVAEARGNEPEGLNVGITGSAAVGGDMLSSASESIRNTELTTIVLVLVILLLVYRAPLLVAIPLVAIGTSVVVATDLLALLTQLDRMPGFEWWNFKVFTTTRIFIVVILFGSGTDFCLFLIARYKEELEQGLPQRAATAAAVERVAGALVASAMTTICGLGMMYFADFGKFRNSGPAIALCLTVALAACLTLAPALLAVAGRRVFWPFGVPRRDPAATTDDDSRDVNRFWLATSNLIIRWPGLILLVSVLLLAPWAYHGREIKITYDFLNELAAQRPSVQGARIIRRHFPAGELGPITVLAHKADAHLESKAGDRAIGRLTKQLYDLAGVESVRSITEPLGDRPGTFQPLTARGRAKLLAIKHKRTKARFLTQVPQLKGDIARFDLVLADDPFSPDAIRVLNEVDGFLKRL